MKKTTVSVTGCSLADILYADIDFTSQPFADCASKKDGDGGLAPGKLVFADALETFTKKDYALLKQNLTGGRAPHAKNLGGPAVVGAINASQILSDLPVSFRFYGATGNDKTAEFLRSIIAQTPLNADNYITIPGPTPSTDVLSDPRAHNGKGERTFINTIGSCYSYTPDHLGDAFFDADIVWFGATALVPPLHENLSGLLKRASANGRHDPAGFVGRLQNISYICMRRGCDGPFRKIKASLKGPAGGKPPQHTAAPRNPPLPAKRKIQLSHPYNPT